MTLERWNDDRLDRFATAVEQAITNLNERSVLMTAAIEQLSSTQNQVLSYVAEIQREVQEIQQQVRGLQTESRRVLDRLLGDSEDSA
jgi:ABC-type transporter Mla subunit MlaD